MSLLSSIGRCWCLRALLGSCLLSVTLRDRVRRLLWPKPTAALSRARRLANGRSKNARQLCGRAAPVAGRLPRQSYWAGWPHHKTRASRAPRRPQRPIGRSLQLVTSVQARRNLTERPVAACTGASHNGNWPVLSITWNLKGPIQRWVRAGSVVQFSWSRPGGEAQPASRPAPAQLCMFVVQSDLTSPTHVA